MKLSRWNSFIPIGKNSGIIYNSFTDTFVCVKEKSKDFIFAKNGEIDNFSKDFTEKLIKAGALVDEDLDEVGEVASLIEKIDNDDSSFQLIINPTLDCNFSCWYCYENHIKGSAMSASTVTAIKMLTGRILENNPNLKRFYLSFFGGEPLLCFDSSVKDIITECSEQCKKKGIILNVHFTTNAFLVNDGIIDFLKNYNSSFQITLDGGRENHNNTRFGRGKTPSFDTILQNVRKISEAGMHITLRINYTSKVIDSTSEIIEKLGSFSEKAKDHITVDYQRVWQDIGECAEDETYQKAAGFRKKLNALGYRTSNNHQIDMVKESCYADKKNELLINFNGDIFACTARDFTHESRLGELLENGELRIDKELLNRRRNCRFTKDVCHNCRIAPICGGGCRTKCLEHSGHDGCSLGRTEEDIDNMILERFETRFIDREL